MQRNKIQIILHIEKKPKIMVISSSNSYSKNNLDVIKVSSDSKTNLKRFINN